MKGQTNYDDVTLLSVTKAAKLMRVGKARIHDLIHTNKIRVIEINGTIRIPYFELRRSIENLCDYYGTPNSSAEYATTTKKIITSPKDLMEKIRKSGDSNEQ